MILRKDDLIVVSSNQLDELKFDVKVPKNGFIYLEAEATVSAGSSLSILNGTKQIAHQKSSDFVGAPDWNYLIPWCTLTDEPDKELHIKALIIGIWKNTPIPTLRASLYPNRER